MPAPALSKDILADIEREYTWRQRELILYKTKIPNEDSALQQVLLRASVPFVYSHWEGFVKIIVSKYLKFVSEQYLKNSELSIPFLALSLSHSMSDISTNSYKYKVEIIESLAVKMENRSNVPKKNIIQTKSNLKYEVFSEILFVVGLNESDFIMKKDMIDSLVDARNTIAHGNYKSITYSLFNEYFTEVISVMELLKTKLENCVVLGSYKKI